MADAALTQRLERERRARQEAERLLEAKSQELYRTNEELRQASDQLRDSGLRLQAIIDAVALSLITIDDDGMIQSLNAGTVQMFGFQPDELMGTCVWNLLPRVLGGVGGTESAEALRSENLPELDGVPAEIALRKDGSVFPADFSISDTVVNGERILVVAIRDITKRVEREQEHRALESQLLQAQKLESLGTLAGGIAHEINTPTQYVGDNLRFLAEAFDDLRPVLEGYGRLRAALGEDRAEPLGELLASLDEAVAAADLGYLQEEMPNAIAQSLEGVQQVANIVQAMKEFSHPGSKEKAEVDLNHAVENALAVSRNSWKHVAELETDLDPGLGLVPCLAAEINQVLLNLIVNAAHAMEAGAAEGRAGRLGVSSRAEDGFAVIRIADNGCGMPEEVQARIFDPFFTTKEVGKGTGQGLSISRDIVVNKHGGELTCESTPGEGTCFILRLPREAASGAADTEDQSAELFAGLEAVA